jgi:hypothetical protein
MDTHKARPIPEPALQGLKNLITKEKLPSDEEQRKATLKVIKWVIKQRELYTATFEKLKFQEQALSINGQISSLEHAIRAHVDLATKEAEEGRDPHETRTKCIEQLDALRTRL